MGKLKTTFYLEPEYDIILENIKEIYGISKSKIIRIIVKSYLKEYRKLLRNFDKLMEVERDVRILERHI